jgi:nitrogen fixation NifU-like protein
VSGGGGAAGGGGDFADIYGDMILDHNRKPRNYGSLAAANRTAEGNNPLCGDRFAVHLRLAGDRIEDIAFEGQGCAISTASASIMTEVLRGMSVAEARRLFERFHGLLTSEAGDPGGAAGSGEPDLGKLEAFAGVREYPMRVKCATLAWHALVAALNAPPAQGDRHDG